MKKVIFSFIMVMFFSLGVSELMAQSAGLATLAKTDGTVQAKEIVTQSIQAKLPVLYQELKSATSELDIKLLTIETLLYKTTLSDLNSGSSVRNSYTDNMEVFLRDFPYEYLDRKIEVVNEFNQIVFIN